ncbi:hypothetical protein GCM10023148_49970 [Actinokineospora soli]
MASDFGGLAARSGLAEAEHTLARLLAAGGDLQRAFDTIVTVAEDPVVRAHTLTTRGSLALDLGHPDLAADAYAEAAASFTTAGWPVPAAYAAIDLAGAYLDTDRPDLAAEAAEDAIGVMAEIGDTAELHRAKYLLALAHRALDQPDHALALLAETGDAYRATEDWGPLAQCRGVAADILDALDRDAEAAEHYTEAADAFARAEAPLGELHNRRRAALSWHWVQDPRARTTLAEAESHTVDPDTPAARWELAMLGYDGARILDAAGEPEAALTRLDIALTHFTAIEATHQTGIAQTLRGRILLDLNRNGEAKSALNAALAALPDDDQNRERVAELLERAG